MDARRTCLWMRQVPELSSGCGYEVSGGYSDPCVFMTIMRCTRI